MWLLIGVAAHALLLETDAAIVDGWQFGSYLLIPQPGFEPEAKELIVGQRLETQGYQRQKGWLPK